MQYLPISTPGKMTVEPQPMNHQGGRKMALDMKAEALSSEPRELLGLFHAIGDPGVKEITHFRNEYVIGFHVFRKI